MKKYDIAAFVWPAFTGDEMRTRMFWPNGEGEWQSVRTAEPKFEGHTQPRKPLWGYVNEADPKVMEMEIDEATKHGVNVFIYDWYWFDDRPCLENCLNDGFLKAANSDKMKFYVMWANHNVNHYWNKDYADEDFANTLIWQGGVDRTRFEKIVNRLIEKYFHLSNYYTIDGCPVFMIYELSTFIEGIGGLEEAKSALDWMRERVKAAGFKDVHIQITGRGDDFKNVSGVDSTVLIDYSKAIKELSIDSLTHYQFVHFTDIDRDYLEILEDVKSHWSDIEEKYGIPYYPHVSCGWDNNPRFKKFRHGIVKNNTPENFEKALRLAKDYADKYPERTPLITINSWNEWTETSYLEPDDLYGYGYLDAIKKVFVDNK